MGRNGGDTFGDTFESYLEIIWDRGIVLITPVRCRHITAVAAPIWVAKERDGVKRMMPLPTVLIVRRPMVRIPSTKPSAPNPRAG